MLRDALRRLLWLGPALILLTLPAFWALCRVSDRMSGARASLPMFFNANPAGARERALAELSGFTQGGPDAESHGARLVELGGAILPHVLPRLDSLSPDARGRVAEALAPIARRMGLPGLSELETPGSAALFWSRFWNEHSIDFRPAASRRAVERLSLHSSPIRQSEVLALDTYALEDVMQVLADPRTLEDLGRVKRLTDVAAHVTGRPWTLPPESDLETARRLVETWQTYWLSNRSEFVTLSGLRRLTATVIETRYGRWLEQIVRLGPGRDQDGTPIALSLRQRAPITVLLVLFSILTGYPAALVLAAFAAARRAAFPALDFLACLVLGATTVGVAQAFVHAGTPGWIGAPVTMVLGTVAFGLRHFGMLLKQRLERPHARTFLAFGASPFHVALIELRSLVPPALALALSDVPVLLSGAFVVEYAFHLRGLGQAALLSLRSGELSYAMALLLGALLGHRILAVTANAVASVALPGAQQGGTHAFPHDGIGGRP